ncbi:DUF397 domain-containing protein [Streptomyces sp. NPDC008313]|uniref:DUF397 domain-containing protein n=1 Tax=Streptomyces sp. NPDC008313 TaxID=3364826 RepID=UPI0036E85D67
MSAVTDWQKSSFSGNEDAPNCIEVAASESVLWLRESDEPGVVLSATRPGLGALIRHVRRPAGK